MVDVDRLVSETSAPSGHSVERIDARELPPPQPLQNTLERLAELEDGTVLVQLNDRAPQHLFPKLDDRGFRYETTDVGETVATVIWRE